MLALEDDRWVVTLVGYADDLPPTDPAGWEAYARTLPTQDIASVVVDGEPLDDPVPFRYPASIRCRYERLDRFPEGLLAFGDAICSFNPIYGQGMTVAALEALALRDDLQTGIAPRSQPMLRAIARVIDAPWELAIGADLALPGVDGRRTRRRRIVGAYVNQLQAAAAHDPALARAFVRVTGLVDRPEALLKPSIAVRVLRARMQATSSAERHSDTVDGQSGMQAR